MTNILGHIVNAAHWHLLWEEIEGQPERAKIVGNRRRRIAEFAGAAEC